MLSSTEFQFGPIVYSILKGIKYHGMSMIIRENTRVVFNVENLRTTGLLKSRGVIEIRPKRFY